MDPLYIKKQWSNPNFLFHVELLRMLIKGSEPVISAFFPSTLMIIFSWTFLLYYSIGNLSIQKTKIKASGSITSWQIDGETVETVTDFIYWGSKITADGNSSHEIKRRLRLGKKVMTDLDGILKSRDITLPTKVRLVKAMVFPVVMYGCESWTIKKAERRRIDAFELWCWRRLLRVPWTARRSIQSILKEISPEYSLEGLMLKWKLQYFGHLMWRTDSLEKTLMLGKIEGRRRRVRCLHGITDSMTWVEVNSGSWWWTGRPGVLVSMGSQRVGHDWATELNWLNLKFICLQCMLNEIVNWLLLNLHIKQWWQIFSKNKRSIFHTKTVEKKTWKFWSDLFIELQNQILFKSPESKTFGLGISLTSVKFKELYLKFNLEACTSHFIAQRGMEPWKITAIIEFVIPESTR